MTLNDGHYSCTNDDCKIYLGAWQWHYGAKQQTIPLKQAHAT